MQGDGLDFKTYLPQPRKQRDPISAAISLVGLGVVIVAVAQTSALGTLIDPRSILIVVLGTVATVLFQYDIRTVLIGISMVASSFVGTPDKGVVRLLEQLDEAIVNNSRITALRDGKGLDGELLNDVVYMYHRGLVFDEINAFVTSRVADAFLTRRIVAAMLHRAALIAPALGLFGTVIGLTGVLRSMNDPAQIGPSMSLALMTTAYGAGLGSLVFTPLAGRLEHHNTMFLEAHKQLLGKVGILLIREERRLDTTHTPRAAGDDY